MINFLLHTKEQEYIAFLITLSDGKPLDARDASKRIELFEKAIGTDLATLDRQFLACMLKVR